MSDLSVLVVDADHERCALIVDGLRAAGHQVAELLDDTHELLQQVEKLAPDVIIISADLPSRDSLENLKLVNRNLPKPIVMFVDESVEGLAAEAVKAGVSAYVVDGLRPARVQPLLESAIARFNEIQELRQELEQSKADLAARKVIDQAKGILMKERGIDEGQAFAAIRKMAMDRGLKLAQVAEDIIRISQLLRG